MRKLWVWWRRIPRPVRILCNLLLTGVLLTVVYLFRGCPDLTAQQAYRRTVTRELVEPGKILGIIEISDSYVSIRYDRLLIAESKTGVQLLGYDSDSIGFFRERYETRIFAHREKRDTVTLMATPSYVIWPGDRYVDIPVILFDEVPQAMRAQLDLCLNATGNDGEQTYEYHLEAERKQGGYFEFHIVEGDNKHEIGDVGYALDNLCTLFIDEDSGERQHSAVARLYDKNGALVLEEELILQSPASEAHAERGDTG